MEDRKENAILPRELYLLDFLKLDWLSSQNIWMKLSLFNKKSWNLESIWIPCVYAFFNQFHTDYYSWTSNRMGLLGLLGVQSSSSIVIGLGHFLWLGLGMVRSAIYGYVWIWKISPKNVKFFNFLPFGSKKTSLGRVKKYPGQRRIGLLFTAGQK